MDTQTKIAIIKTLAHTATKVEATTKIATLKMQTLNIKAEQIAKATKIAMAHKIHAKTQLKTHLLILQTNMRKKTCQNTMSIMTKYHFRRINNG